MKKILETTLGLVTVLAIMLACAENADGSCNLVWTFGCLAVAVACGVLWGKLQPKPVHVPEQAYTDLNGLIEDYATEIEGDRTKEIEVEADLPGDMLVCVKALLNSHSSRIRFTDGAWGAVRTFTEYSWSCEVEILEVIVTDADGNVRESDFNEGYIETTYESTDWK